MPMLGKTEKQSWEVENYSISYAEELELTDGFSILEILVVSPDPADTTPVEVESYLADVEGQRTKMFLKGGTPGLTYKITVRIQTDSGRKLEDDFKLRIKDY